MPGILWLGVWLKQPNNSQIVAIFNQLQRILRKAKHEAPQKKGAAVIVILCQAITVGHQPIPLGQSSLLCQTRSILLNTILYAALPSSPSEVFQQFCWRVWGRVQPPSTSHLWSSTWSHLRFQTKRNILNLNQQPYNEVTLVKSLVAKHLHLSSSPLFLLTVKAAPSQHLSKSLQAPSKFFLRTPHVPQRLTYAQCYIADREPSRIFHPPVL